MLKAQTALATGHFFNQLGHVGVVTPPPPKLQAKNYYLLTGCKGRTRKYKPKVFHTARACEGCLENQGLVFLGTARAPS